MYWSQTHIPTCRNAPGNATLVSHQLLTRAGFVKESESGIFALLPLGERVLEKIQRLLHDELERVSTSLHRGDAGSGASPRLGPLGAGSSPHVSALCAPRIFEGVIERSINRLGVPLLIADSDCDGDRFLSFLMPLDSGDERILQSDRGNYRALAAVARTGDRPWTFANTAVETLEKVHTPALKTVREVGQSLNVPPERILKTIIFRSDATGVALSSGVNPLDRRRRPRLRFGQSVQARIALLARRSILDSIRCRQIPRRSAEAGQSGSSVRTWRFEGRTRS